MKRQVISAAQKLPPRKATQALQETPQSLKRLRQAALEILGKMGHHPPLQGRLTQMCRIWHKRMAKKHLRSVNREDPMDVLRATERWDRPRRLCLRMPAKMEALGLERICHTEKYRCNWSTIDHGREAAGRIENHMEGNIPPRIEDIARVVSRNTDLSSWALSPRGPGIELAFFTDSNERTERYA